MPTIRSPRRGSMQNWPRRRANRMHARIRSWTPAKEAKPLGFAGYKAGMTHVLVKDTRQTSVTKNEEIRWPVTVVECPPMKVIGAIFYHNTYLGRNAFSQILADKIDKDVARSLILPKKTKKFDDIKHDAVVDVRLLVHTQPRGTALGKKKPEVFELGIGGEVKDKLEYAKKALGTEIKVEDVLAAGQQMDSHAITTGRGFQGPVKRFGVSLRSHKSEKTRRGPGSIGPWLGTGYWRVGKAGQTGFHQRVEYNKIILKVSNDPKEINPKGGFLKYGNVKAPYILVKGSLGGPKKRLIKLVNPLRPSKKIAKEGLEISYTSTTSQQ